VASLCIGGGEAENIAATAREEGLRITPLCSYAAAWMRRNEPDLIA
jgi:predicted GNAT family acetyltransferase